MISLSLQIHIGGHLGEFPNLRPFDPGCSVLAAGELVEDQIAEVLPFPAQHELFRIGLSCFKEAEAGIGNDADAFERHQRSHDVGEVCG